MSDVGGRHCAKAASCKGQFGWELHYASGFSPCRVFRVWRYVFFPFLPIYCILPTVGVLITSHGISAVEGFRSMVIITLKNSIWYYRTLSCVWECVKVVHANYAGPDNLTSDCTSKRIYTHVVPTPTVVLCFLLSNNYIYTHTHKHASTSQHALPNIHS